MTDGVGNAEEIFSDGELNTSTSMFYVDRESRESLAHVSNPNSPRSSYSSCSKHSTNSVDNPKHDSDSSDSSASSGDIGNNIVITNSTSIDNVDIKIKHKNNTENNDEPTNNSDSEDSCMLNNNLTSVNKSIDESKRDFSFESISENATSGKNSHDDIDG